MPAGIWGSAFTVLLQRVLRERKLPSDTVDEMSNQGDLREELRMSFRLLFIMPKIPEISVGNENGPFRYGQTEIIGSTRPLEVVHFDRSDRNLPVYFYKLVHCLTSLQ